MGVNIYSYAMVAPGPTFNQSDQEKFNWPVMSAAQVDLEDYPESHEVLGAEVYIDTRLYNGHDVVIYVDFFNDDTDELLFSDTYYIPQPYAGYTSAHLHHSASTVQG